jgi:hypothetical protein
MLEKKFNGSIRCIVSPWQRTGSQLVCLKTRLPNKVLGFSGLDFTLFFVCIDFPFFRMDDPTPVFYIQPARLMPHTTSCKPAATCSDAILRHGANLSYRSIASTFQYSSLRVSRRYHPATLASEDAEARALILCATSLIDAF